MTKKEEKALKDKLRETARVEWHEDGSVEIDDNARVSLSFDEETEEKKNVIKGAYVQAWVWVDFTEEK